MTIIKRKRRAMEDSTSSTTKRRSTHQSPPPDFTPVYGGLVDGDDDDEDEDEDGDGDDNLVGPTPPSPVIPARPQRSTPRVSITRASPAQASLAPPSVSKAPTKMSPPPNTPSNGESVAAVKEPSAEKPKRERNIDKVVLGNMCFETWYNSYYSRDMLGDGTGGKSGAKSGAKGGHTAATIDVDPRPHGTKSGKDGGAKASGRGRDILPVLERLYVCPCCFKYSKELLTWWSHVRICQEQYIVPGEKIYIHPKDKSRRLVPQPMGESGTTLGNGMGGRRHSAKKVEMVEEEVLSKGEYSVWEVDGAKDTLFCQNLSLFGKLFLETKSVFYDVTGFKFYLLVYTAPPPETPAPPSSSPLEPTIPSSSPPPFPPSSPIPSAHISPTQTAIRTLSSPPAETRGQNTTTPTSAPICHKILGFFSKEKVSWDLNNLACILIFPPYQRKGLSSLLIGLSYEISRREQAMGGPEKPISELGRKSYRKYWGKEVARYLEGLTPGGRGGKNGGGSESESGGEEEGVVVFDITDCSQATWIAPEDCLGILRDMGVEEGGVGPPSMRRKKAAVKSRMEEDDNGEEAAVYSEEDEQVVEVRRVKMDKSQVRKWVAENRISLQLSCDPDGFVSGYVKSSVEVD